MKNLSSILIFFLFVTISCRKQNHEEPKPIVFNNSGSIDSKGGVVKTSDGASVDIPANVLTSSQNISVTNVTASQQKVNNGSFIYEMKPEGLVFSDSVTITLPFDDKYLDKSSKQKNYGINIRVLEGDFWKILPTKIDLMNKVATTKTKHFSLYAIFFASNYADYFRQNRNSNEVYLNVPYYWQSASPWCHFFSTSMIAKYAGYDYKAPNFAALMNMSIDKGLTAPDWIVYDNQLNYNGIQTENVSPPWYIPENMCGYILNKLNEGYPVLIASETLEHSFVVIGHNSSGFYVNDPSGDFLTTCNIIHDRQTLCGILVNYDTFLNSFGPSIDLSWDPLNPEYTMVIKSKGFSYNKTLSLNFLSNPLTFDVRTKDLSKFSGSLVLDGKYSPDGYIILNESNGNNLFDGSNYFELRPICSNTDTLKDVDAILHYKIDNIDVSISPKYLTIPKRNSAFNVPTEKFQLNGLSKGDHKLKVELWSTDHQILYDSWTFNFGISNSYNLPPLQPLNLSPADNATAISTSIILSWNCIDPEYDPLIYDVYFGTSNPPTTNVSPDQITKSYSPVGLTEGTDYYWQIVAKDNHLNSTMGPIWKFSTNKLVISLPTVTTDLINVFTQTSATFGGNVTDIGGATVTQRGVYWGINSNPELTGTKLQIGSGKGVFSASLTGLTPNTTYYVMAYATNSAGTNFGSVNSFTTSQLIISLPTVTTDLIIVFTQTSATFGGNVTDIGGATVTQRGVYWGINSNPELTGTKLQIGSGKGVFSTSLTGLTPNTTYYVMAYATNSAGTNYGSVNSFTTDKSISLPVVNTYQILGITQTSASGGGYLTTDGNAFVTTRGVCWSTSQNPTIANSITTDGTGGGIFHSNLTGLQPNTTYYVRAYATNSAGTGYGTQVSFTTGQSITLPTVTTTSITSITQTSANGGGNVTSDGNATVTARGVCWSTSQTPTTANFKTTDGTGSGIFSSNLTSLQTNITYYVRAYATNSAGTGYGTQVSFTTQNFVGIAPVADFTASPTSVTTGQSIQFTDNSTNAPTSWLWDFGDGNTSTIKSPAHSYSSTGTFTVSLTATNNNGNNTKIRQNYITVSQSGGGDPGSVPDNDGNTYKTVTIGTQVWMAENLKTTRYRNGDQIEPVTDNAIWASKTTGAYCWYGKDVSNKATYGALYNWYAVADTRNIAPVGWHVATDDDWKILEVFLGMTSAQADGTGWRGTDQGDKLKETGTSHWLSTNAGTNSSGFTALPGGYRYYNGTFYDVGNYGSWWSSTANDASYAWDRYLNYHFANVNRHVNNKQAGFSVRCVRD